MVENVSSNRDQFLPIVPFANCVFSFAQLLHKLSLIGVLRHFQHISQSLHFQSIRMQIPAVQPGRALLL